LDITLRFEKSRDYKDITRINDLAFGQKNEGILIEHLRKNRDFLPELSIVAEKDCIIIGHILFFPIQIKSKDNSYKSVSLVPMAVLPEYQNQGIGSKLIRYGLEKCREKGCQLVIVLGHPEYYPRFGFEKASKWGIRPPFEAPDEAFMAIELVEGGLKGVAGVVEYPDEYSAAL
jgi:putative acetyltransferase